MPDSPFREAPPSRLSSGQIDRIYLNKINGFPVVAIGASAGGLDACRQLLSVLPADSGMAFILVLHLDPTHESLIVDLLASHTRMSVHQATEGMMIEPSHFYVIPPATYLSVSDGLLHLSSPEAPHGARLPFDFLLKSLAKSYGSRAIGIILSGTGADGSLGLKDVKDAGGLIIAQDPGEASYAGMPQSAVATGDVDHILSIAQMPQALVNGKPPNDNSEIDIDQAHAQAWLLEIIDLLRTRTAHDFRLYKYGTLVRRIERRMAMAAVEPHDKARYLDILKADSLELNLLAKDLLINVTHFFRDPKVFDLLAEKIIPDLISAHTSDQPLRIWIAGCSTGEETYSLAMVFREAITAANLAIKLQVFASDVDPDAVAAAREGLYPDTISAEVSANRLARFFSKEDNQYRIMPELRSSVVFTVQDVLADPPFSRLDFVSCRNLLIYLRPEAQAKVIALFHFALRENGLLLLGSSETIGNPNGRFEVVSKPARLYRHVGRSRPGTLDFSRMSVEGVRAPLRPGQGPGPSRQAALADLCRRMVMDTYAPAAVLINRKYECLYSMGPTDHYLRVAPGHPTHDLLAMARESTRTKLRAGVQRASQENSRIVIPGGRTTPDKASGSFSIVIQPVRSDGEDLLLICFVDDPKPQTKHTKHPATADASQVETLERELSATRAELQAAIRNLEVSSEEQKSINEEALSVNEEYQSTNEELLTSKEELQSLNEELTALNSQLQETLDRQRTTSNDLQNVLYSTDLATLFLDTDLKIRFFTPATRSLFNVIPSDIGRPLADLSLLASDSALLSDSQLVLQTLVPFECEIEGRNGSWYIRRILPYRTQDNGVDGVVITFADITERRRTANALEAAKRQAEVATIAKSRFLAAASHDLRQPLQTLALLQGLLAKTVEGERVEKLVTRLDETLGAMSGMLNTLLDINQIEAGTVQATAVDFSISDLLDRLRDEFTYHAQAQNLHLSVVSRDIVIHSDPRLLEQILRNLLSNALKYTKRGKILLGCRRYGNQLNIEIWDTGVGIPPKELQSIFEEYHQLDNAARDQSRGLGLGLSIVQRLATLLGHQIHVRSHPGKGSVFTVEVQIPTQKTGAIQLQALDDTDVSGRTDLRTGEILIIEDDPDICELLRLLLKQEGHHATAVFDGNAALELVTRGGMCPDLILADYNLPGGFDGLEITAKLRERLHRDIPVIILTGDISTDALREISRQNCVQLNKPVKLKDLIETIRRLLPAATPPTDTLSGSTIFVVDDDDHIRSLIRSVLEQAGHTVQDFATCEAFLAAYRPGGEACLLVDAYFPGMSGLELLERLQSDGQRLPAIMITGHSEVAMAVQAMKAGATDFVEKPIGFGELLTGVRRALEQSRDANKLFAWREMATQQIADLTVRERQILDLVLSGHPSKNIAADLGISQRTVENHRASIMKKTGTKSLPDLVRLALAATQGSLAAS